MKVLCICEHGNIRSVALAYILKTLYQQEAIAVGFEEISEDTYDMLYKWADRIIWLIPPPPGWEDDENAYYFDEIGDDIWHNAQAQELTHKLYKELAKYPGLFDNQVKLR